jgi:GNAT superfamily N-acetyltransferase
MDTALQRGDYAISTDPTRLDVPAIHAFLSGSYWSKGIPLVLVQRAIDHSLCFGLYHRDAQVGFARVVTDRATFAYLSDVYLLEAHRGQGLSKWLMQVVRAHADLQGLRRFLLATRDAHGLYRQFGFTDLAMPTRMMEVLDIEVYTRVAPPEPAR